jgi:hypothetical protein
MNELYGNTLGGLVKNGIRLSYSKNPLGVRAQPPPLPMVQPPPAPGPLGIQEAFHGRQPAAAAGVASNLSGPLDMPARARDEPTTYTSFASSPPSRFFPAGPIGPQPRQSFGQFSSQYTRPQLGSLTSISHNPIGPASPPPIGISSSAMSDPHDERLLPARDVRHYPLSPSPGLETARAA